MRNYDNPLASAAYKDVRDTFRNLDIHNRQVQWDENGWIWLALQTVWSDLSHFSRTASDSWYGPKATADDLSAALIECGVPQPSIRPFGSHTLVTLDNLSFVYRSKSYKYDGEHLLIAPHITGLPFGKCGHSFLHPFGPLPDVADAMLYLDRSVPEIRDACRDALADAQLESTERASKTVSAESMLIEIFGGEIPENVRFHVDGLIHPQDLDCVRLEIKDSGKGSWYSHQVDIPLDLPKECFRYLSEMLVTPAEPGQARAVVEPYYDEEYGWIPIVRFKV